MFHAETNAKSRSLGISQLKIAILKRALLTRGVDLGGESFAPPNAKESLDNYWNRVGAPILRKAQNAKLQSHRNKKNPDRNVPGLTTIPTENKHETEKKTIIQNDKNAASDISNNASEEPKLGFIKRFFRRIRFWK